MNDEKKLKLALAGMLPERIKFIPAPTIWDKEQWGEVSPFRDRFFWSDHVPQSDQLIHETEWKHICWLITKDLTANESCKVYQQVKIIIARDAKGQMCGLPCDDMTFSVASWQQIAEAIVQVKGIQP